MRNIIRLGDPTSHGGKFVSVGAQHVTVDGIAVACVGDVCVCPVPGHTTCLIVEGNPHHLIDNKAVAYEGHKTTCGAALIATVGHFTGR
jgi:uncharacterized Zn-binding protein involved in type VI secretion